MYRETPMLVTGMPRSVVTLAICLVLASCGGLESDAQKLANANQALGRGDARVALIEFKNLHDANPDNADAAAGLVQALLASGEASKARVVMDAALARTPTAPGLMATEIDLLSAEGSWERVLEGAAKLPPEARRSAPMDMVVARALTALGRTDEAAELLDNAIRRYSGDVSLIVMRAFFEFDRGNPDQSLNLLSAARARLQDPRLAAAEASLLLRAGRASQAEVAYQAALNTSLGSSAAGFRGSLFLGLAEAQIALRKLDPASKSLQGARDLAGNTASSQITEAKIAAAKGDTASALRLVDKIREGKSDNSLDCFSGVLRLQAGDKSKAEGELASCVEQQPSNIVARKILAGLQLEQGKSQEAARQIAHLHEINPYDLDLVALESRAGPAIDSSARVRTIEARYAASPKSPRDRVNAARSLIALERSESAAKLLEASIDWGGEEKVRRQLRVIALAGTASRTEVVSATEALLLQAPDDPSTYLLASSAMRRVGDEERAVKYLDAGLDRVSTSPELFEARGRVALETGDSAVLQGLLARAQKAGVVSPALVVLGARVQTLQGRPASAVKVLEAGLETDKGAGLQLELARTLIVAGEIERARTLLASVEKEFPGAKAAAQELRADILLKEGKAPEALAMFRSLASVAPRSPELKTKLAAAQIAAGNIAGGTNTLREALALNPSSTPVANLLVRVLVQRELYEDARTVARKLASSLPGKGAPLTLEAYALAASKDPRGAAALLRQAYRIEPSGSTALQLYSLERALKTPNPERILSEEWSRDKRNPAVALALSEALIRAGNRPQAIQILEQANASAGVPQAAILNNLAWWYQETKDARARKTAESAFALAPEDPAVLDTYGWILVQEGATAEGLAHLRKAHDRSKQSADIATHLARAEQVAGNGEQARQAARAAVAADPALASSKELLPLL